MSQHENRLVVELLVRHRAAVHERAEREEEFKTDMHVMKAVGAST